MSPDRRLDDILADNVGTFRRGPMPFASSTPIARLAFDSEEREYTADVLQHNYPDRFPPEAQRVGFFVGVPNFPQRVYERLPEQQRESALLGWEALWRRIVHESPMHPLADTPAAERWRDEIRGHIDRIVGEYPDPNTSRILDAFSSLFFDVLLDETIDSVRSVQELAADDWAAQIDCAFVLLNADALPEAQTILARAVELPGPAAIAHLHRAALFHNLGTRCASNSAERREMERRAATELIRAVPRCGSVIEMRTVALALIQAAGFTEGYEAAHPIDIDTPGVWLGPLIEAVGVIWPEPAETWVTDADFQNGRYVPTQELHGPHVVWDPNEDLAALRAATEACAGSLVHGRAGPDSTVAEMRGTITMLLRFGELLTRQQLQRDAATVLTYAFTLATDLDDKGDQDPVQDRPWAQTVGGWTMSRMERLAHFQSGLAPTLAEFMAMAREFRQGGAAFEKGARDYRASRVLERYEQGREADALDDDLLEHVPPGFAARCPGTYRRIRQAARLLREFDPEDGDYSVVVHEAARAVESAWDELLNAYRSSLSVESEGAFQRTLHGDRPTTEPSTIGRIAYWLETPSIGKDLENWAKKVDRSLTKEGAAGDSACGSCATTAIAPRMAAGPSCEPRHRTSWTS